MSPRTPAAAGLVRRPLRSVLAWAAVAAALLAVGSLARDAAPAAARVEGDVAQGENLYQIHCAACHSPDGRGGFVPLTGAPAPPISGSERVTISYARLTLRTGRMPPAGDPHDNRPRALVLSAEQQDDVLAFLVQRFNIEGDLEDPGLGDPAAGLEHYATNCAQCHGATGAGGVAGGGAWTPAIARHDSLVVADAVRTGPFQMPRFDEGQLSDEQVADIAAFLGSVGVEGGALVGLPELNPVYASGFAGLLTLGVLGIVWLVAGQPFWFRSEPPADDPHAQRMPREGP
jgi:ubiquinol-cytochrome c reductase cytochrome c subunit